MSFSLDLKAFADRTNATANAIVRDTVIQVDRALVEKTPVGNPLLWANPDAAPPGYVGGRLRANWQYGENAPREGELWTPITGPFPDKNPIEVAAEAGGKTHYLVNNLPYAQAIEDGHSEKQAPAGMVGITVLEFQPIVREIAASYLHGGISSFGDPEL